MPIVWCVLAFTAGCDRGGDYAQPTPEDVFESARAMVQAGDHERLHELLWTDDPRERAVYLRLGRAFGALAELAAAVDEKFPEDVEALRSGNDANGLLGDLLRGAGRRGRNRGDGPSGRDRIQTLLTSLAADPYGFIERSQDRISSEKISHTKAAIMWDGNPVLPPFGMVMTEVDGRWYVVPPITNPLIARWRPATDEEFAILGYLADVVTNTAQELAAETRRGENKSLEGVAESAGEKAFIPASMCVLAYSRAVQARRDAGSDESDS